MFKIFIPLRASQARFNSGQPILLDFLGEVMVREQTPDYFMDLQCLWIIRVHRFTFSFLC